MAAASHRRANVQPMDVDPIGSWRQTVYRRADGVAGRRQDHDFPSRTARMVDARLDRDRPGLKMNRGKPSGFASRNKGPQAGKHVQPFVMSTVRFSSDVGKNYFRFFRNVCPAAVIETLPRPFVG